MVTVKAARMFFDRQAVVDQIGAAAATGLGRFGSFVRTRARTSMKKGGKSERTHTAQPGQPPRVHAGQLKDLLFFSFDPSTLSVVVGPVPFKDGKVPRLLEFGGTAKGDGSTRYLRQAAGRDAKGKFKSLGRKRVVMDGTLRYRGNPFMGPALRKELPNMPNAWASSIRVTGG